MTKKNPCLFRNYILYGSHFTFTNRHRFPVYRKQIVTFVLVIAKAFLSYFAIKQEIYEGNRLIHIRNTRCSRGSVVLDSGRNSRLGSEEMFKEIWPSRVK